MKILRLASAVAAAPLASLSIAQAATAADTDFPTKLETEIARFERIVRAGNITVQ